MRRTAVAAPLAAALALALGAPTAAAQDAGVPAPPPTAGEPALAPPPPEAPVTAPGAAQPSPGRWKGWELSVLGWGGAYAGGAAEAGAGGFDATLVFQGDLFAAGARAGSEKVGSGIGSSLAAVGGVMLPLSARTRLDVLADAGLGLQLIPQEGDAGCGPGTFCDGRESARVLRPEVGARAGFAFLTADGRVSFHLGAFARLVAEERVDLDRRTCVFSSCTTTVESRTVGGKAFGAYLGLGFPRRL